MKAIVCRRYGPPEVLAIEERQKPTPKDDEVLIKVRATTVTSGDWRVRSMIVPKGLGTFARLALGLTKPRQPILGTELAGEIEAVGSAVRSFKVGDAVFAFPGVKMGAYVEYKCMPEDGLVARKPAHLSHEEAAALSFGGMTAIDFFRRAKIKAGDEVLINGASGGVGTAAIQVAKHFGAKVSAVCSGANLDLVRSLGAEHAIDYHSEDFTQNGHAYDIIIDTAGTAPWARCARSLKSGGRLLVVLGSLGAMLSAPWVSMTTDKRVIAGPAGELLEDFRLLAEMAEAGAIKPVIDRRYPFAEIVEAHRYVDAGHKKGNVVVTV